VTHGFNERLRRDALRQAEGGPDPIQWTLPSPGEGAHKEVSMGVKGRRTYTEAFKTDAIKMVLEGGKTVRQVARDLDLEPGSLHTWIRQRGKRPGDAAPKSSATSPSLEDEVRRLRKELERVTEERDILKKATAYFAKESK
jgi:transposase